MSREINRRGLLGILAAAPILAASKPALPAPTYLGFDLGSVETAQLSSGWVIHEGTDFSMVKLPSGEQYALLSDETVRRLAAPPDDFETPTRPPEGLALRTDDRTPGEVSAAFRLALRSMPPAVASDLPFTDEFPVLKLARAC